MKQLLRPFLHLLVLTIAFWSGQLSGAEPKSAAAEKKKSSNASSLADLPFDRKSVARVEGIRFKLPEEALKNGQKVEGEFSFISRGRDVDLTRLNELAVKKADLSPAQIETLIQAVYGKNERMPSAACYNPHHLFLFYDASGALINTVELCFSCTGVSAMPNIPEKQWYRHDFRKLAKLCEECGIGLDSKTAEEYSKILDARERE